jgi:hypothetical protein
MVHVQGATYHPQTQGVVFLSQSPCGAGFRPIIARPNQSYDHSWGVKNVKKEVEFSNYILVKTTKWYKKVLIKLN